MGHKYAQSLVLTATAMLAGSAFALPVIPGATGFGIETPAGRGGTVYRVTSLADSGPGSLRECVAASGPRVCIFETSGVISLSDDLLVWNPKLTIAGQTAPSPGILLRGASLRIHASDVLVQHIAVRPGNESSVANPANRDALTIDSGSKPALTNIVIDHCSFSWAIDENGSARQVVDLTIRNSIFSEPLADTGLTTAPEGYNFLAHASTTRIAMIGNLLSHSKDRNPLTNASQMVFVNNVVYNYGSGTALQNVNGVTTQNAIMGNVYRRGPPQYVYYDVLADGKWGPLILGTKVHLDDNIGLKFDGSGGGLPLGEPWDILRNDSPLSRSQLEAIKPPTWVTGLVAAPSSGVLDSVLTKAGARPADRNTVDARIIADVRNRTGQVPNCVTNDGTARCAKNVGGWPVYQINKRTLSLPADPNGDSDGDGYTNLEEFLHDMAASVEGTAQSRPSPPVVTVD